MSSWFGGLGIGFLCPGPKIIFEVNANSLGEEEKTAIPKLPVISFKGVMVRYFACWAVHSLKIEKIYFRSLTKSPYFAVLIACCSFCFHSWATSFANGSSGLGAERSAWIERRTVRICNAGDHLSFRISFWGIKSSKNQLEHGPSWENFYITRRLEF